MHSAVKNVLKILKIYIKYIYIYILKYNIIFNAVGCVKIMGEAKL